MELSLTPELENFVRQQVESGQFPSPNEMIIAAIKRYEVIETTYKGRYETLRYEINLGIEAADQGETVDGEVVFENLRQKLEQRRIQAD